MSKVIKGAGGYSERQSMGRERSPANRIPSRSGPIPRQRQRQGGVIQRDELEARSKAQEIIQQAQYEADKIRSQAEEYRQRGYEEGYHQGYEEGKAHLTETILGLNRENEERFKQLEPQLVQLAVRIAEKLIGEQLTLTPETITNIVRNALGAVRHQQEIYMRVNPDDYEMIINEKPRLLDALSRARDIDIRADPTIERGGCLIESEIGTIEATLSQQLKTIEKILLGN